MKKITILAAAFILSTLTFNGCATSNTAGGAVAGAATGAIIGGMVGNHRDAMIGAAGGAVAGAMIGKEMDDQEREDRNQYR
jgi:outer membrane lipoprotein SlyB